MKEMTAVVHVIIDHPTYSFWWVGFLKFNIFPTVSFSDGMAKYQNKKDTIPGR